MKFASIGTPAASRSHRDGGGNGRAGFTLLEALVALALVLAFASVLGPHLSQARRIMAQADGRVAAQVLLRSLLDAPFDRSGLVKASRDGETGGLRWRIVAEPVVAAGVMKMQRDQTRAGCDGFTLVEVLAALAIASVIIMASTALIHNVALFFDRGTRGVTEAERLMLAVERLAGDFSSARFGSRRTEEGAAAVAFAGEPSSREGQARIVFVGAGRAASGSLDDDLISLIVEQDGEVRRLVRRRATWPGPRARFEDVTLQDR